jgi:tetratricopeptide (TPR) repeat protein
MQGKLLYGVGGLIIGLVAGFFAANSLNRGSAVSPSATTANVAQAPPGSVPGSNAQPGGMQADVAQTLQKAESEPANFVAQMQAGDMYGQIGRFDKAIEFYSKGVGLNPQNAAANIVLANAYFDSQKFEDAEKYYSKALEIEPNNVNARTDLGATLVERQPPDYGRAIEEFRKALEQDPKSAPTLYYLGIAQQRKGDRAEAEKTLAELEKNHPQSELVSRLRQNLNAKPPTQ